MNPGNRVWRANRATRVRHLFTVPLQGGTVRAACGYVPSGGALPLADDRGMVACARCTAMSGQPGETGRFGPSVLAADAAQLIAAEIERQGLTRNDLARRLGVTPAAISQIVRGANRPSLTQLDRIFAALGVVARITLEPAQSAQPGAAGTDEGGASSQA